MMDIYEAARTFPEMSVTVKLADLMKAGEEIVRRAREDAEREAMNRRSAYDDELLRADQVREILGVSPATLWRWEQSGYLVPVRFGRKVYYLKGSVTDVVSDHMKKY